MSTVSHLSGSMVRKPVEKVVLWFLCPHETLDLNLPHNSKVRVGKWDKILIFQNFKKSKSVPKIEFLVFDFFVKRRLLFVETMGSSYWVFWARRMSTTHTLSGSMVRKPPVKVKWSAALWKLLVESLYVFFRYFDFWKFRKINVLSHFPTFLFVQWRGVWKEETLWAAIAKNVTKLSFSYSGF